MMMITMLIIEKKMMNEINNNNHNNNNVDGQLLSSFLSCSTSTSTSSSTSSSTAKLDSTRTTSSLNSCSDQQQNETFIETNHLSILNEKQIQFSDENDDDENDDHDDDETGKKANQRFNREKFFPILFLSVFSRPVDNHNHNHQYNDDSQLYDDYYGDNDDDDNDDGKNCDNQHEDQLSSSLETTQNHNHHQCWSKQRLQWSLRTLRSEFKIKNTELYFRRYQTRLCHRWFTIVLILNIIVSFTDLLFTFHQRFYVSLHFCFCFWEFS